MQNYYGNTFHWFLAAVEDLADPLMAGRVRIRAFGLHSSSIPVEDLPWAVVGGSVYSAGLPNDGIAPVGLKVGTWVGGFFLDGKIAQQPVVLFSLSGQDLIDAATGREIAEKAYLTTGFTEGTAPQYPHNRVLATSGGHVLEIDDTPGSERISIKHRTGSSIVINPNGDILISATKSAVLESPSPLHITCTDSVTITTPQATITGDLRVDGRISAGDDVVTDADISLNNHKHNVVGVQRGSATVKSSASVS